MICRDCKHQETSHFACAIGSFCKECPIEGNVWEHVFRPDVADTIRKNGEEIAKLITEHGI